MYTDSILPFTGPLSQKMQPLTIFGHWGGPNPWKARIILEEFNIPFEWKGVEFNEVKSEAYLKVNPNGRLPSMTDPNTGITLWEVCEVPQQLVLWCIYLMYEPICFDIQSGAIILYLIDEYDKEGKLSYKSGPEKYLTQQWLMFQVSGRWTVLPGCPTPLIMVFCTGQGPYFGQATWFARFHPEKVPSATSRYVDEMERVVSVLDRHLSLTDKPYLVVDKCIYADLSFVTWATVGKGLLLQLGEEGRLEKFDKYREWMERLQERGVVKSVNERIAKGRAEHNLP